MIKKQEVLITEKKLQDGSTLKQRRKREADMCASKNECKSSAEVSLGCKQGQQLHRK